MYMSIGLLTAVIAAIVFIPLPSHVYCPVEVQARGADPVIVFVGGILDELYVKPGDKVTKDQPLAQLGNDEVDIEIARLTGEKETLTVQLEGLNRVSLEDRRASAQIQPITESLERVTELLKKAEEDKSRLRLVAPRDGTVLPPALVEDKTQGDVSLATWSGSPFERKNHGAFLAPGTKLCDIGLPNRLEVRLIIGQDDWWYVRAGQRVEIMLDQSAEYVYVSKIERRGSETVKESPTHLSSLHKGPLPTQMGPDGVARPLSPVFDALVPLPEEDPNGLLRIGLIGRAKISTAPRTLGERLYRYFMRTFNFEL
jgi:putative peptide zinc metalloprotease protein